MNLLTDDWLRVIGADGRILPLSPPRIGSGEIRDLHAPRADFRGALYQFLIGLLQTACTPENRKAWLAWWRTPPSTDELKKRFAPFLDAFELISENGRPAFMQDLDMPDGEPKQIATLLIDAPGGKTLRDNLDHFVKRGTVEKISPHWAATALFTLQINAPSGGVGHRVSLRGGGPLTTLVLPPEGGDRDTLWHRLWLNVLTGEELARLPGNGALKNQSAIFPWLATTRTSGKKGSETWPEQVHPLQVFWCMPRRIRLDAPDREGGICDLDGRPATALLHGYRTRNHGINYAGSWEHPLTPYVREAGKENLTIKGQPGGLGYRHWLGVVVEESAGKQHRVPATVVRAWQQSRYDWLEEGTFEPRLWAFGYDMDNMKARCWYEATMPILNLPDEQQREDMQRLVQQMVQAAREALKHLRSALKAAWFKRPKDARGDWSFVDANFWALTEPPFYDLLRRLLEAVRQDDPDRQRPLLAAWRRELEDSATRLFDRYALSNWNEDGDLRRVVMARDGRAKDSLIHNLRRNKSLKQLAA